MAKKSHSTANYLLSLVNDILDISKLQAGKVNLVNEPMLIERLIDEIASMQADNIESRGVRFIVEKDIIAPCIEGDATHTKQILMNIVGNAAKFTPKGGHIRLSISQKRRMPPISRPFTNAKTPGLEFLKNTSIRSSTLSVRNGTGIPMG